MKVLFLDFDGVLNPFGKGMTMDFSPAACHNLNTLLKQHEDLKIVVSSAWRHKGYEYVREVLGKNGIDRDRVIDITPEGKSMNRGQHIQKWLDDNLHHGPFVIIDDESHSMDDLLKYLVKTNSWVGLTEADVRLANEILNRS